LKDSRECLSAVSFVGKRPELVPIEETQNEKTKGRMWKRLQLKKGKERKKKRERQKSVQSVGKRILHENEKQRQFQRESKTQQRQHTKAKEGTVQS
jgi:hypothetical protein